VFPYPSIGMNHSPDIRTPVKVFTGRYPFSGLKETAISLKIMGGEHPARPGEAQELGLTDLVWNITLRCWRQDPAYRPTVTEVVGLLREWSVFSPSMEPKSRHAPRSYKQRTVNTPLYNLAPRPLVKNVDVTADHALISQMPMNGNLAPTKPSEIPRRSGQINFQSHELSSDLSPVLVSPREPLSGESHTPPGTNSDDENPLSIVHGMVQTDRANNHRILLTSNAHAEGYGAEWYTKEIAEVA